MSIHPLIQTARGLCTDEVPHHKIDAVLSRAVDAAKHLEDERTRYRKALERIAGAESGFWGRIAHDALRGER